MKQIPIEVANRYCVTIGHGVLQQLAHTIRQQTRANRVCIVSDCHVSAIYAGQVCAQLQDSGFQVSQFLFSAGEQSKNCDTYMKLLNFLAENQLDRGDCLVALGGGVTGDLAGFAAATYLRGICYIQVPTSLLAMVDAAVGGKTGIDLAAGKNLCGAFWQPVAVLCDLDVLNTLPHQAFLDGCAEIIKYAILFDPALFEHLEQTGLQFDREFVINRCVAWKGRIVAEDEKESGRRMLLNLGHTFGHGIEACSHYTISHGRAVAIGTAMICRAARCADTDRIVSLLQQFDLPQTVHFSPEEIFTHTLSDKKRKSGSFRMILPRAIGDCAIQSVDADTLIHMIEEGL